MAMFSEDHRKEEKINGTIYDMSPSLNYRHGIVNGNIYSKIRAGLKGSLCLAFMENLDYKYQSEKSDDYVIPDVMIICDRKNLKGGSYVGVPKFIVETLSPATAMRDLTLKKDIYESAGVSEYWIISPRERAVQIYYLEHGHYILRYSYILEDDESDAHYNLDTRISLREFPNITMTLGEVFEAIE